VHFHLKTGKFKLIASTNS